MKKIALPKISVPKLKKGQLKKVESEISEATDLSKINLRKFNGLTILSLLSYLNVLVLIPILFNKKSAFVAFHAKQGITLMIVWVLFYFSFYLPLLPYLIGLFILICIIIGVINVIRGRERRLPLIGKLIS